jgi:hypothetical protein
MTNKNKIKFQNHLSKKIEYYKNKIYHLMLNLQ